MVAPSQHEPASGPAGKHNKTTDNAQSIAHEQESRKSYPGPAPWGAQDERFIYELSVAQEPSRARMCGFGDRDRRPITSPPIFQLKIRHKSTGAEVDYHQMETVARRFAAIVRIYDPTGTEDKSIYKASLTGSAPSTHPNAPSPVTAASPSIGSQPSYHTVHQNHPHMVPSASPYAHMPAQGVDPAYHRDPHTHYAQPIDHSHSNTRPHPYMEYVPPGAAYANGYGQGHPAMQTPPYSNGQSQPGQRYGPHHQQSSVVSDSSPSPQESNIAISRSLIGMTCATGWTLKDENDKWGIYFIFGDLSVRQEAWFRLRCQVFDITPTAKNLNELIAFAQEADSAPDTFKNGGKSKLPKNLGDLSANTVQANCPCLGSVFTVPISVYSAKKFPGVEESTALSRKFAQQGVKLTVRKSDNDRNTYYDHDDQDTDQERDTEGQTSRPTKKAKKSHSMASTNAGNRNGD